MIGVARVGQLMLLQPFVIVLLAAPVNGEPARWSCAIHNRDQVRPRGVVTALKPGRIWMADKFPESAIGTQGATPEKIPVKMIWE